MVDRKASKGSLTVLTISLFNPSFPQSLTIDFNGCKLEADDSASSIDYQRLLCPIAPIDDMIALKEAVGPVSFRFSIYSQIHMRSLSNSTELPGIRLSFTSRKAGSFDSHNTKL
jgi:hypothetical protein